MRFIRERVLAGEFLAGGWCNLGSSVTAEIAGLAGFDWVLIDTEHGTGDLDALVGQLQAVSATPAVPIVRIAWNDPPRYKRVLDMGAMGVMAPYVNTAEEARQAASSMRYPPAGIRGVAKLNRGSSFGADFDRYFTTANDGLLTVVQIESPDAVANAEKIAAVDGVDVLFIGPLDLSVNLGIPQQFDHPKFKAALEKVAKAARGAGKAAGILLLSEDQVEEVKAAGFTFVALGSDGGFVAAGMRRAAARLKGKGGG